MIIEAYSIAALIAITLMTTALVFLALKVKKMQKVMDDLGKSRTISSDAITRLEELEATIDTLAKGLQELKDSLEKNSRLSRLAIGQVDPLRRNLQELQAALAHANARRPRKKFNPND